MWNWLNWLKLVGISGALHCVEMDDHGCVALMSDVDDWGGDGMYTECAVRCNCVEFPLMIWVCCLCVHLNACVASVHTVLYVCIYNICAFVYTNISNVACT